MKKSDIEHIQRSRFLNSGLKIKNQIDNIVRSINYKYPELAKNIEIPQNIYMTSSGEINETSTQILYRYINSFMKQNLLA